VSYEWDVFLSYRRANDWPRFVDGIFLPMLKRELSDALGSQAKIFHDMRIETGGDWPQELAVAHAASKILICLWSRQYFTSRWCREELGQMLSRRDAVGGVPRPRLIVSAVIHDGAHIPEDLSSIQRFEIQKYASPDLAEHSQRREELSFLIRDLAEDAGTAIEQAPPFDGAWTQLTVEKFAALFASKRGQWVVPSLGGATA
jgi:hypothetical protein